MNGKVDGKPIHGVACYWEFKKPMPGSHSNSSWRLAESFPVDDDGWPMVKTSTDNWPDTRHFYRGWLYTYIGDPEESDLVGIPGRMVTKWSFNGVDLVGFKPPSEVPSWLAHDFLGVITRGKWQNLIQDGLMIEQGTVAAAKKILFGG